MDAAPSHMPRMAPGEKHDRYDAGFKALVMNLPQWSRPAALHEHEHSSCKILLLVSRSVCILNRDYANVEEPQVLSYLSYF